jgi:hypothetical protein
MGGARKVKSTHGSRKISEADLAPLGREKMSGEIFVDPGAGSDAADEVAFGLKLLENAYDGAARSFVLLSEIASSGKTGAGTQLAFENGLAEFFVNPASEGYIASAFAESEFE